MPRPFLILGLLVAFLSSTLRGETHEITLNQAPHEATDFGTYFFGLGRGNEQSGIWPCNLWSNFDARNFAHDADALKLEGGNAAILVFPYFDVADTTGPTAGRFAQLRQILEICESRGIQLTLRLGYSWDNGYSNATHARQIGLLVDPELRKSWYHFCEATYSFVARYQCFRGAFVSWEDYWGFFGGASGNEAERTAWASYIHYPRPIVPSRKEPAMEEFFDYFDHLFAEDFFANSQQYFPGLGMEVRMDDDPIFHDDVMIKGFVHKKQFAVPTLKNVYVYWGPFMGAPNQGDTISADTAVHLLELALAKARTLSPPNARLIMSQFNFKDNTPGFSHNSSIKPEELGDFIRKSREVLTRECIGIYTWSNISYYHNAINNGTFAQGSTFWEFDHAIGGTENDKNCVTIFPGGSITQKIERNRAISANLMLVGKVRIEFSALVPRDGPGTLTLGKLSVPFTLKSSTQWQRYVIPLENAVVAEQTLRIFVEKGALISDVSLLNHKQEMGSSDPDFTRDRIYSDLAWAISRGEAIATEPGVKSGVTPDNWVSTSATFVAPVNSGHYQITIDLSVPEFVRTQAVQISLQPTGPSSEKLPLSPGPHRLVISGRATDRQVFIGLAFSVRESPPHSADLRELAAHVDAVGP